MILDPEFREVGETVVAIWLSKSQAEAVQGALSDVLLWVRGWRAAAGKKALDNDPIGTDTLRELNLVLKRAIEKEAK